MNDPYDPLRASLLDRVIKIFVEFHHCQIATIVGHDPARVSDTVWFLKPRLLVFVVDLDGARTSHVLFRWHSSPTPPETPWVIPTVWEV